MSASLPDFGVFKQVVYQHFHLLRLHVGRVAVLQQLFFGMILKASSVLGPRVTLWQGLADQSNLNGVDAVIRTLLAVYDIRYNHSGDLPTNIDVGVSRSKRPGAA